MITKHGVGVRVDWGFDTKGAKQKIYISTLTQSTKTPTMHTYDS